MTDHPAPPEPIYGVGRDPDGVTLDVTDAALTRLAELLERRPALIADLADATAGHPRGRRAALTGLRGDPDVRAACVLHLEIGAAVELATALIAAASPPVGGRRDRTDISPRVAATGRTPR